VIWKGRTVVAIASGPSLSIEDCELVRNSGLTTVVTNLTFRLCPWADVLYGFDAVWWKQYRQEVANFAGEKVSASRLSEKYGAQTVVIGYRNSGCAAAGLAMARGASRVVLLGYDAMFDGAKRHWHEDYPRTMDNAGAMGDWPRQFELLARSAKRRSVQIVNASRRTRLKCFPLMKLEEALCKS
jgi:hypothetical protein